MSGYPFYLTLRTDEHRHGPTFLAYVRLDVAEFLELILDSLQHADAEFRMRHLPTPEAERKLHLVAILEEAPRVTELEAEIVILDLRPHLDLLHVDDVLVLLCLPRLACLLVLELPVVHNLAHGGARVGSDFDQGLFGSFVHEGILNVPERLAVYLSEADKALWVSRFFFRHQRLGQMWKNREVPPGVANVLRKNENLVLIDVTGAEGATGGNGHAYFRRSPWVSSDILVTLYFDLSPGERGLEQYEDWSVWYFPPDYIEQLMEDLEDRLK